MNRQALFFTAAVVAFAISGCDSGATESHNTTSSPSTPSPDLAVSMPPMPSQVNRGRQNVAFDPCVKIDDPTIVKSGFDPPTRERNDLLSDNYSFIGCKFTDKEDVRGQRLAVRTMSIWSTNVTLDEFRQREGENLTDLNLGDRPAIQYIKSGACYIAIRSTDGALNLSVSTSAAFTAERPCDRIQEIAGIIVSTLPN